MANTFKLRDELTDSFRHDLMNAVNELVWRGKLPHNINYAFEKQNGKWGVALWVGDRAAPAGQVVWCEAVEMIVAAGNAPVIGE